jgi:hypothetical protein
MGGHVGQARPFWYGIWYWYLFCCFHLLSKKIKIQEDF